ncbi:MAG: hypothetical protein GWP18_02460, partial [Proteobacteria bacterium]|nr:hypothetical protein [Pseudomonadota bacterium]
MEDATAQTSRIDGYASALLDIANAEGESVADEMYRAAQALNGNAELVDVLSDPRIP